MTRLRNQPKPVLPIIDRLKQHWLISMMLVCVAVASATWRISYEILVIPRDFEISRLKDQLQKAEPAATSNLNSSLALPATGVRADTAVTTNDGRCIIRIHSATESNIHLSVALDADKPTEFPKARVGDRLSFRKGKINYYVDLQAVRGNLVDLVVHKMIDDNSV